MAQEKKIPADLRLYVLLFWLLLTAFNIGKAWHIDDTFHLEAATWIAGHPLSPMSGTVNWDQHPQPLHEYNQPPLYFYMVAAVLRVAGENALALHLFQSVFTLAALLLFVKLALLLHTRRPRLLLFFFALNPAFVVNQNLMTDVPLLSAVLAFVYGLILARANGRKIYYLYAALVCSAACLIKYSALPLVLVLPLVAFVRKDYRWLPAALLPVAVLFVWSYCNYQEYGGIHLLGRERALPRLKQLLDFANCLGAIALFPILYLYAVLPRWARGLAAALALILPAAVLAAPVLGLLNRASANQALSVLFTLNGGAGLVCILLHQLRKRNNRLQHQQLPRQSPEVLLCVLALSAFIVLLAPFIATRHLLLVVPLLLLVGNDLLAAAGPRLTGLVAGLTAVLGLWLGVSDWLFADYYQQMARRIQLPPSAEVWFAGHWGWQRYASQNGWRSYNTEAPPPAGGYLVVPRDISQQGFDRNRVRLVQKHWLPPAFFSCLSVSPGRLYSSGTDFAPWQWSSAPIDTVFVYRLTP